MSNSEVRKLHGVCFTGLLAIFVLDNKPLQNVSLRFYVELVFGTFRPSV